MKILYLTNLYPPHNIGGYELICETVNRAMTARGHETMVLTSNHIIEGRATPADEAGVRRTLRIHGFFGHPWLGIPKLRELEFHNNAELRRAIADFEPDLIHVFNLGGISKSLVHSIERLGVPAVYFISDHWLTQSLDADVWLRWWNRESVGNGVAAGFARSVCERAGVRETWDKKAPTAPVADMKFRRIYFCSEFLRKKAEGWGRDVRHAEVIHNSVDTARFHGGPAGADKPCDRLLFVGRLTPEKGICTVLQAMKWAKRRFPGTLTVCGRGEPAFEAELRDFVHQNELPVEFTSATPDEMPDIYRAHDALIFASEWEEPFALTPLEAMACGLPVISTTTGGSAEIFQHRRNALTFTAGNDQELAACILALHSTPELRARIAVAGYRQVRSEFCEDRIMDRVEACLRETVVLWPENAPAHEVATTPQQALTYA